MFESSEMHEKKRDARKKKIEHCKVLICITLQAKQNKCAKY